VPLPRQRTTLQTARPAAAPLLLSLLPLSSLFPFLRARAQYDVRVIYI
jgi:hypothetical protein